MKIKVLTLFPELYSSLNVSIIGKALEKGAFEVDVINIRDYSTDKHKKCDDYPYGGGAGMVMTPQPLHNAIINNDAEHKYLRIYLSPKGERLNQGLVERLAKEENIMLINGSYEGIDQRVIELDVDMELSIGDYVITSGDLASQVIINAVARYIPDVLGSSDSTSEESFATSMLEYPHYTRPQTFEGKSVPDVLLSGNHAEIEKWRRQKSWEITHVKRPDLLEK
ncbi:MAG TPA: tRNA (guanosine(37)-N1)-methyltransferase TrmD [Clostridia bacterium]|nr:tRNA (guanosine(37)-N1)-methyltransferase TrmD [Clostridia bacterium]